MEKIVSRRAFSSREVHRKTDVKGAAVGQINGRGEWGIDILTGGADRYRAAADLNRTGGSGAGLQPRALANQIAIAIGVESFRRN